MEAVCGNSMVFWKARIGKRSRRSICILEKLQCVSCVKLAISYRILIPDLKKTFVIFWYYDEFKISISTTDLLKNDSFTKLVVCWMSLDGYLTFILSWRYTNTYPLWKNVQSETNLIISFIRRKKIQYTAKNWHYWPFEKWTTASRFRFYLYFFSFPVLLIRNNLIR